MFDKNKAKEARCEHCEAVERGGVGEGGCCTAGGLSSLLRPMARARPARLGGQLVALRLIAFFVRGVCRKAAAKAARDAKKATKPGGGGGAETVAADEDADV